LGLTAVEFSVPRRAELWLAPLIGIATGVVAVATGVFGIPAVPYQQALGLEKEELVQALGLSFTVSTLALTADLAYAGMLQWSATGLSVLALAPAFAGMLVGQVVRARVRPDVFRLCFFIGLLLLGAHLALRALL
jgi:uncharacterized membrane protein YfcA